MGSSPVAFDFFCFVFRFANLFVFILNFVHNWIHVFEFGMRLCSDIYSYIGHWFM